MAAGSDLTPRRYALFCYSLHGLMMLPDLPDLASLELPGPAGLNADVTLQIYQALRPLLPDARPASHHKADRLIDCLDAFDAFILDGFGVINVGMDKITGIDEFFAAAKAKGKPVVILTNGASNPSDIVAQKYLNWGLPVTIDEVISSRDALACSLPANQPHRSGLLQLDHTTAALDGVKVLQAGQYRQFDEAEGFVFLGSVGWAEQDQAQLEASLTRKLRPVWVGNPDVSAPHPTQFSSEPGYWMARAMQAVPDLRPRWFGKPHAPAFQLAIDQVNRLAGRPLPMRRIAMVGDSPHTDILGGSACGLGTILVTAYGLLRDHDADHICSQTGIYPDWQVKYI